jgi:hypothetical protein
VLAVEGRSVLRMVIRGHVGDTCRPVDGGVWKALGLEAMYPVCRCANGRVTSVDLCLLHNALSGHRRACSSCCPVRSERSRHTWHAATANCCSQLICLKPDNSTVLQLRYLLGHDLRKLWILLDW